MSDGLFDFEGAARIVKARRIWDQAGDLDDGDGELYLRELGGKPPWPDALRFSSDCYNGAAGASFPAVIAAVTDTAGRVMGVARYYLGEVTPRTMMLGSIAGNAVRLGHHRHGGRLVIAESLRLGIKLHYDTDAVVWCALSAAGITRLSLPHDARVEVAPSSAAGRAAAEKRGLRIVDGADRMAAAAIGRGLAR